MSKFKSWDEFYSAFRKALDEKSLKVRTIAYGDEGIFVAIDTQSDGVLYTFNKSSGILTKYVREDEQA